MRALVFKLFFLFFLEQVKAHDLRYELTESFHTVVVRAFFPNLVPFSYEFYEVYHEGEKTPFQTGHFDALGRAAILPDRPGEWRIKAFSQDGHGFEASFKISPQQVFLVPEKPWLERYAAVFTGVGLILGIFALVQFYLSQKRSQ